jgi:hypothetical protein
MQTNEDIILDLFSAIEASLAQPDRASRASQPNTSSTAGQANRRDTSTDSARR